MCAVMCETWKFDVSTRERGVGRAVLVVGWAGRAVGDLRLRGSASSGSGTDGRSCQLSVFRPSLSRDGTHCEVPYLPYCSVSVGLLPSHSLH